MMHSTSSTSNHPVDHTSPNSNHTSALNNNPAINSSLKHQQQLHPSINPSSQPQKTSFSSYCQAVLEQYLESLCSAQLKEKGNVCEFYNSNIVINKRSSPSNRPGFMQGYLTKKGRNFGGWQTRYYVLDGPVLEYFDSRRGTKLGFLGIIGAQIGRQQQQRSQDASDDSYWHAFLIRMHKEKEGKVDHILCAETDKERDSWVEALTCYVSGCLVSAEGTISTSKSSNRTPTGITSSPASNGCSRRQTSLDGFNCS
ncbi:hypothetical protein PPACK8108_LOCUS23639 [Phakopsora pachyrhizi]|uniref:PH domain-containing protein n=1 Tax=Phakopsora pachyrhizi TaxID=170000 RepID=A0AAV0BSW7_PHAPC|nr:hypothetical protein PPACK8108_LOCUS23639 [Phakopsora pachyrhizi]